MKKNKGGWTLIEMFIVIVVCFLVLGVGCLGGYIKNVVKVCQADWQAPYKNELVHTIGLIPPIGCITGWINIADGTNAIVNVGE